MSQVHLHLSPDAIYAFESSQRHLKIAHCSEARPLTAQIRSAIKSQNSDARRFESSTSRVAASVFLSAARNHATASEVANLSKRDPRVL